MRKSMTIMLLALWLSCLPSPAQSPGAFTKSVCTQGERLKRTQKAADRFMARLDETLDISAFLEEALARNALEQKRRWASKHSTSVFSVCDQFPGISANVLSQTDDATVRRKLAAEINFLHLSYVQFASVKRWEDLISEDSDSDLDRLIPDAVKKAAARTRYFPAYFSDDSSGIPNVDNRSDLEVYLAELELLNDVWRRNLPTSPLQSPIYRDNQRRMQERLQEWDAELCTERTDVEEFGPRTLIILHRAMFVMLFTEEGSEAKLVALGHAGD